MIKIATTNLKDMTKKISKCTENRVYPITAYWLLKVSKDGLEMMSTDSNNFIKVVDPTVKTNEEWEAIVQASQFGRLVDKTSVSEVKLNLKEDHLQVVGNGDYKVKILLDEDYPTFELEEGDTHTISVNNLTSIANVNKSAVSINLNDGQLTGYYADDNFAITTDGVKICMNKLNTFSKPVLLTPEMVKIIGVLTEETVVVTEFEDKLMFEAGNTVVYGVQLDGLDDYPQIAEMFAECGCENSCKLSTLQISNILDRLTLFINPFDKNELRLQFKKDYLQIQTPSGSYEKLNYVNKDNVGDGTFTCSVNSVFMKDLVNSIRDEHFVLKFGHDSVVIELESEGVRQILATGEEA